MTTRHRKEMKQLRALIKKIPDESHRAIAVAEYIKYFRAASEWDSRSLYRRLLDKFTGKRAPEFPTAVRYSAENYKPVPMGG